MKELLGFIAALLVLAAFAWLMQWTYDCGVDSVRKEAVAHGHAEYFPNESGQQVWRWLP